jgi:hypothetical protein
MTFSLKSYTMTLSLTDDKRRNYALTIITALRIICLIVRTNTDKLTAPYINYSIWAPASVIAFEVVFARGAND